MSNPHFVFHVKERKSFQQFLRCELKLPNFEIDPGIGVKVERAFQSTIFLHVFRHSSMAALVGMPLAAWEGCQNHVTLKLLLQS